MKHSCATDRNFYSVNFEFRQQISHDLRKKDEKVILEELTKQRKELAQLRVSKVSSQPQVKLSKIKSTRKAIARVLTVLSEKRIAAAREQFKNAKKAPRDLRMKRSRAARKALTPAEAKKMTLKQQKKHDNFKMRKFALLA